MINNAILRLFIVLLGSIWAMLLWASTPVTGTLTATQTCDAYVSFNKSTNPDNTRLQVDQSYTVFEVNRPVNPKWYRIRVPGSQPAERWVAQQCGQFKEMAVVSEREDSQQQCQTAGLEDSYKLALSWQPAFCESKPEKPECQSSNSRAYQANNFTLHGLWPNRSACGINYGYCGTIPQPAGDFCDYPILDLDFNVRKELQTIMPSARAGSCLQRHEWYKHGTCQNKWSIDAYHELAIDLTRQFNESGIGYFMSRNIGKQVSEAEFFKKVDCALGDNAHKRLHIKCKKGNLVDVYIALPVDIKIGENLGDMILRADTDFKSTCAGSFRIDAIGRSLDE